MLLRIRNTIFICLSFLFVWQESLLAAPFLPLRQGALWKYEVRHQKKKEIIQTQVKGIENVNGKSCFLLLSTSPKRKGLSCLRQTKQGVYVLKAGGKALIGKFKEQILLPPLPILKYPLKKGKQWQWQGSFTFMLKKWKVHINYTVLNKTKITVPAGTYTVWKIKSERFWKSHKVGEEVAYYAQGIGAVKRVVTNSGLMGKKRKVTHLLLKYSR